MPLYLKGETLKRYDLSNNEGKQSFFTPFQEDEISQDFTMTRDGESTRKESQMPTIGSSLKIDSLNVINYSLRMTNNLTNCATNDANVCIADDEYWLQSLETLLEDKTLGEMIFKLKPSFSQQEINSKESKLLSFETSIRSGQVMQNYDRSHEIQESAGFNETLKYMIQQLSQMVLILDEILECMNNIKNWQNHVSYLNRCMLVLKQCLCEPAQDLLSIFDTSKQDISQLNCEFIESKGTCLGPMIVLQRVKNIPPQILKSIFFEVESSKLTLFELEQMKIRYSFMLLFHMFNLELRNIFDLCLKNNCSEFGVLSCVESFLWNAVEMDKSDLILRLDDEFWKWNNHSRLIDHFELTWWCTELLSRLDKNCDQELTSCHNEDDILNIKDKYNLAKLFINEFNDAAISYRIAYSKSLNEKLSLPTNNNVDYTEILTRFANSLETQITTTASKNQLISSKENFFYGPSKSRSPLLTSIENLTLNDTMVVNPRQHFSTSYCPNVTRVPSFLCTSPNYDSHIRHAHRNHSSWLHHLLFPRNNGIRHKLLRSLHKIKDACSFWHRAKPVSKMSKARHPQVSAPVAHDLRYHEEFQNTTFSDFENVGNRFTRLRDKKRRIMFKFFGED